MGCDIHGWIEKKVGRKWIAVKELTDEGRERNYQRFAALTGGEVRGNGDEKGPKPKGAPLNMSETTRYALQEWGSDAHSMSYMGLAEALKIYVATDYNKKDDGSGPTTSYDFFRIDVESDEDLRLVFWFDN